MVNRSLERHKRKSPDTRYVKHQPFMANFWNFVDRWISQFVADFRIKKRAVFGFQISSPKGVFLTASLTTLASDFDDNQLVFHNHRLGLKPNLSSAMAWPTVYHPRLLVIHHTNGWYLYFHHFVVYLIGWEIYPYWKWLYASLPSLDIPNGGCLSRRLPVLFWAISQQHQR